TAPANSCTRTGRQEAAGREQVLIPLPLAQQSVDCYIFTPEVSAGCQTAAQISDLPDHRRANDGLYPGGYYQLMGFFVGNHIEPAVLTMRMVSWTLCLGLLGAAAL